MSPDLEAKLFDKYPELFASRNKSEQESPICRGIECGDGWFDIVENLCHEIRQYTRNERCKLDPSYEFFQIKEKFAGLRIYDSGRDEYIEGLINMAEAMAYRTCETCGNKGVVCQPKSGGSWLSTKCHICAEVAGYRPALNW